MYSELFRHYRSSAKCDYFKMVRFEGCFLQDFLQINHVAKCHYFVGIFTNRQGMPILTNWVLGDHIKLVEETSSSNRYFMEL